MAAGRQVAAVRQQSVVGRKESVRSRLGVGQEWEREQSVRSRTGVEERAVGQESGREE